VRLWYRRHSVWHQQSCKGVLSEGGPCEGEGSRGGGGDGSLQQRRRQTQPCNKPSLQHRHSVASVRSRFTTTR
jgi:hypothetical protein